MEMSEFDSDAIKNPVENDIIDNKGDESDSDSDSEAIDLNTFLKHRATIKFQIPYNALTALLKGCHGHTLNYQKTVALY